MNCSTGVPHHTVSLGSAILLRPRLYRAFHRRRQHPSCLSNTAANSVGLLHALKVNAVPLPLIPLLAPTLHVFSSGLSSLVLLLNLRRCFWRQVPPALRELDLPLSSCSWRHRTCLWAVLCSTTTTARHRHCTELIVTIFIRLYLNATGQLLQGALGSSTARPACSRHDSAVSLRYRGRRFAPRWLLLQKTIGHNG